MSEKLRKTPGAVFAAGLLLFAPRPALEQDAPVRLTATMLLEKRVVTLHEPVLIDLAFENPSDRGVVVNLGDQDEKLDVKILEPDGKMIEKPKSALRNGWASPDVFDIPQGVESVASIALGEWFTFGKVGSYRIDVTVSPVSSLREPFSYTILNNSAVLDLTVLPRDEQSLERACAGLLARAQHLQSPSKAVAAAKALSRVNDPVAVPFLVEAMKEREFKGLMIDALARLRTNSAIDALISASQSSDQETKGLARSALAGIGVVPNVK